MLPEESRAICYYRNGEFRLPEPETDLRPEDEVILLTHSKHLAKLSKRFQPEQSAEDKTEHDET